MYFPKFFVIGMLGFLAVTMMPFFIVKLVVFLWLIRMIFGMAARHRYRRHFACHQAYHDDTPEPLEMGDYRFYARRFEREQEKETRPTYSEKDLV